MHEAFDVQLRYLQATSNATSANYTVANATAASTVIKPTMGQVAATTLKIYGIIFLALFLLYILFRPIYKAAYNARGFQEVNFT